MNKIMIAVLGILCAITTGCNTGIPEGWMESHTFSDNTLTVTMDSNRALGLVDTTNSYLDIGNGCHFVAPDLQWSQDPAPASFHVTATLTIPMASLTHCSPSNGVHVHLITELDGTQDFYF